VRIEAAFRGVQPVYFYIGPDDSANRYDVAQIDPQPPSTLMYALLMVMIALLVLTVGSWMMRRNLQQGRADIRGAGRFAVVVMAFRHLHWAVASRHVPLLEEEISGFAASIGRGVFSGGLAGIGYLALEPGVRRRWPWRLVSWSRLLEGQWRDPLIGRDL